MIKTIIVVSVIGLAIGILTWPFIGNITSAITIQNITSPKIFTFLQENWWKLVSTIGGIGTFLGLIVTRIKNRVIQTKTEETQSLQLFNDNLQIENQQLREKVETLQEGVPQQVQTLTSQLNEANKQVETQRKEITQLTAQKNEAESLANVLMHPTESDMINLLKKSGYTITKTVD